MLATPDGLLVNELLRAKVRDSVLQIIRRNYTESLLFGTEPLDYEMKISLTLEAPINTGPRRLSIDERIKDLTTEGCIRPSQSNYTSAVVLVKKKNGQTRMCIDFRGVNKLTVRDNYPLPLIDDCLLHLSDKGYFSLLDMKSAFNQVRMHEDSIKYTSLVNAFILELIYRFYYEIIGLSLLIVEIYVFQYSLKCARNIDAQIRKV